MHINNQMATDYTVELVEPNEGGLGLYLSKYKPFRLNALKTDPSCKPADNHLHHNKLVLLTLCSLWIELCA